MPNEPTPSAMDKKPKPQFGCTIMNQDGSTGRIVTDWFKIANDDRSWCYVMYDHQAGYCHMVEYAVFILPEGHPHYNQKINVIAESPIATVESQAKRIEELEVKSKRMQEAINRWLYSKAETPLKHCIEGHNLFNEVISSPPDVN